MPDAAVAQSIEVGPVKVDTGNDYLDFGFAFAFFVLIVAVYLYVRTRSPTR